MSKKDFHGMANSEIKEWAKKFRENGFKNVWEPYVKRACDLGIGPIDSEYIEAAMISYNHRFYNADRTLFWMGEE